MALFCVVPLCNMHEYDHYYFHEILYSNLTLSPTAEKHHPYTCIGLRRPRATTIVAGMYSRRLVLSLVPAYKVCVCKCGGAP